MTVFRLFSERTGPPTTSYVVGRAFVVGIRGADAAILTALEQHRGRELVTAEELMACVPLSDGGVDDLIVVTVDGVGGDEASPDAGALSDADSGERRITAVARGSLAVDIYSVGGSRRFSARGIRPFAIAEFRAVTAFALVAETDEPLPVGDLGASSAALPPGRLDGHGLAWSSGDGLLEETTWRPPVSEQTVILPRGTRPPAALDDTVISIPRSMLPPEAERTTLRAHVPELQEVLAVEEAPDAQALASFNEPAFNEPVLINPVLNDPALNDTMLMRPRHPRPEQHSPLLREPEVREETLKRTQQFFPVFRIGDQPAESLDGVLYLGRSPRVPRVVATAQATAAVRALGSPTQAVSGTHASLERSGTTIVITDLGSRNGTIVHLPGAKPRRLRGGESLALPPSSRVELGDDNVIHVLSPAPVYSVLESGDSS